MVFPPLQTYAGIVLDKLKRLGANSSKSMTQGSFQICPGQEIFKLVVKLVSVSGQLWQSAYLSGAACRSHKVRM
jgi:hypothetical protein